MKNFEIKTLEELKTLYDDICSAVHESLNDYDKKDINVCNVNIKSCNKNVRFVITSNNAEKICKQLKEYYLEKEKYEKIQDIENILKRITEIKLSDQNVI